MTDRSKEALCYTCKKVKTTVGWDWMCEDCREGTPCTYPECKCPFDMGPDHKCLRGFSRVTRITEAT
jgi:hypothetical protein